MTDLPATLIEGLGHVELPGTGPWSIRDHNHHSFDIVDAAGAVSNPHITPQPTARSRGVKRSMHVALSNRTDALKIVDRFNADLAAQS
ncbi:hypothetical protein SAMN03159338_1560 [Sphingomonas sp. NFR04]|uniref:hypothetical protein n=1 Tax=Sphingomonas sp. NFR04 TaxID=1566283 RepID=UPI0008EDD9F8|nr:hypothetical protein [Sphingomonas sp. NFR04]SFJ49468.1 hypothetical protein SAMN03159338_1560 [Sphingomonas sp. NFR04]